MPHFMIVLIPYINLLNLSWITKCQFLRAMEFLTDVAYLYIIGNKICLVTVLLHYFR